MDLLHLWWSRVVHWFMHTFMNHHCFYPVSNADSEWPNVSSTIFRGFYPFGYSSQIVYKMLRSNNEWHRRSVGYGKWHLWPCAVCGVCDCRSAFFQEFWIMHKLQWIAKRLKALSGNLQTVSNQIWEKRMKRKLLFHETTSQWLAESFILT